MSIFIFQCKFLYEKFDIVTFKVQSFAECVTWAFSIKQDTSQMVICGLKLFSNRLRGWLDCYGDYFDVLLERPQEFFSQHVLFVRFIDSYES